MLDARVTIIDGMMTKFERGSKVVFFKDKEGTELTLNYDILVLTMGLMDKGIDMLKEGEAKAEGFENVKGLYSMDDPYIYSLFGHRAESGPSLDNEHPLFLMTHKKRAKGLGIYGRSLDTFCFIQGLLSRGHDPTRLKLIIPPRSYTVRETFESNEDRIDYEDLKLNEPDAFLDDEVAEKAISVLESKGVEVFRDYYIVSASKHSHDADSFYCLRLVKEKDTGKYRNFVEADCGLLITSYQIDIDMPILRTIQENGLVYNGRLIVRNNFQTDDKSIFACGKLVEFSQRYRNFALGRSLRLDKYSGRELGQRLARSVLEYMGILKELQQEDPDYEELPSFCMPIGQGGYLPGGLIYYRIQSVEEGMPDELLKVGHNREPIVSDNLKEGQGHYLKFEFDNNGIVSAVTYLGTEPISVPSLVNLIGLSETYLNRLSERFQSGLIENLAEFMSENWALALYHEWFSLFRHSLKIKLSEDEEDIKNTLDNFGDYIEKNGFLDRATFATKNEAISGDIKNKMKDDALDFIKRNMNHLPMYYVPGTEFK